MLKKNMIARILHLYIPTIEFEKVSIEFGTGKKIYPSPPGFIIAGWFTIAHVTLT